MRHVFVLNPAAGKGKNLESTRSAIIQAAADENVNAEIFVTQAAGDGERYARGLAASGEPLRLYACGGDGTLNELLNGTYGFDNVELGAVPIGSGNDYIKNYSDPAAFSDIRRQLRGSSASVDVLCCNERLCMNLASVGFDCDVARRMGKYKNMPLLSGSGAYSLAVVVTFLCHIGRHLRTFLPDGEQVDRTEILLAVGNGICYGGGYYATPRALLNDGLLDVSMVSKMPRIRILRLIGLYKAGLHLDHPDFQQYLIFRRVPWVVIESDKPLQLNVDGEIVEEGTRVEFRITEKQVRFVLPEGVTLKQSARPEEAPDKTPETTPEMA